MGRHPCPRNLTHRGIVDGISRVRVPEVIVKKRVLGGYSGIGFNGVGFLCGVRSYEVVLGANLPSSTDTEIRFHGVSLWGWRKGIFTLKTPRYESLSFCFNPHLLGHRQHPGGKVSVTAAAIMPSLKILGNCTCVARK